MSSFIVQCIYMGDVLYFWLWDHCDFTVWDLSGFWQP